MDKYEVLLSMAQSDCERALSEIARQLWQVGFYVFVTFFLLFVEWFFFVATESMIAQKVLIVAMVVSYIALYFALFAMTGTRYQAAPFGSFTWWENQDETYIKTKLLGRYEEVRESMWDVMRKRAGYLKAMNLLTITGMVLLVIGATPFFIEF